MHISEVTYQRLFTVVNYKDNVTIGVVVALTEDDDPSEAYDRAKAFVDDRGKLEQGEG